MDFKIEKETIVDALTKIQGITGKKTNLPITSNVLILVEKPNFSIKATDLEVAFSASYKAEVFENGSTAVPSKKLYEITKAFPSDIIAVKEIDNKWIKIENEKVEYSLVGMEPVDFPTLPSIEGIGFFKLEVDVLRNMINKTIYSVLGDEGRAQLSGIFFEGIKKEDVRMIRMVSTDGHRLSKIDHVVDKEGFSLDGGFIVPKTGIIEILKILDSGGIVEVGIRDNNLIVKRKDEIITIRLIEGEFPNYEMVIPKQGENQIRLKKEDFTMMLRRMSILSSDKYAGIRLRISSGQIEASTTNPEVGESKETLTVSYEGKSLDMAFNPRYFIETLNSMDSDEVVVRFKDEENPCTIEGPSDPGFLSVIMPMRV